MNAAPSTAVPAIDRPSVPAARPGYAAPPAQGTRRAGMPDPRSPGDPLDHPDPWAAADATAVENLLRCWVREQGIARPGGGCLQLPLPGSGNVLHVPVHYWSATGWHRFGAPALMDGPDDAPTLDAVTLAALLAREAACQAPHGEHARQGAELIGQVADSVCRTTVFLTDRRARPADPDGGDLFLYGEQSLLLGPAFHPAPNSRADLRGGEAGEYSAELRGSFPLHWLAVHRSVLTAESAWTERGRVVDAHTLAARLAGLGPALPPDTVPLPLHPWRAHGLRRDPAIAGLFEEGLLHDLGPHGEPWHPTSSPCTVYRPGAPAMLGLSLGPRRTGARRAELRRGVEVHRLLRGGLAERWRAACPGGLGFDIVRDPAWLGAGTPGGAPLPGLEVVLRHNPFGPGDDAVCVAGLVSARPWPGRTTPAGHPAGCSRLAAIVARLAHRTGRPAGAVCAEWFLRYLEAVVRPLLWLDGAAGIVPAAHQRNTLVLLDRDGWPAGGRHRGSRELCLRESHRAGLEERLPGIGRESGAFVPDESADERFAHHLGVDNVLGLIGAFGAQRLADERILLAALRRFLTAAAAGPAEERSSLPGRLLESPTLSCPAPMLTALRGADGLATIANPLATPAG